MIFITAKDHLQSNTDGFSPTTMLLQFFTVFKPFGVILFIPPYIRTRNTERKNFQNFQIFKNFQAIWGNSIYPAIYTYSQH